MHLSKAAISIIFAALLLISASDTTITTENGGSANFVVSISPDVPADLHILTGLIQWVRKGSEQLFASTRCHLYLRNVTILLPQTWVGLIEDHAPATNISHGDGHIRVEPGNPLYGKRPYTEQSSTKCCAPGDVIKVSPDFITLAYPPDPDHWPWYQGADCTCMYNACAHTNFVIILPSSKLLCSRVGEIPVRTSRGVWVPWGQSVPSISLWARQQWEHCDDGKCVHKRKAHLPATVGSS